MMLITLKKTMAGLEGVPYLSLRCPICHVSVSSTPGDYFGMADGEELTCAGLDVNGHEPVAMQLVQEETRYRKIKLAR